MKKMSKKIVFFGNEKLATGIPDAKPVIREAVRAAGFELEQIVTGKLRDLQEHEAELAVLAAYGRIIPQSVLDQFPLGVINVHPSLLPAYRGPTPIEQAILDGANKTGVSIMRLTAGMDEGPIYKQRTVPLTDQESKAGLAEKLQQLGAELLVEVLPGIADGSLQPRNQPHPDRATYSRLLTKEDGVIDWNKSAERLDHEVRAFAGWPKSRTELGGIPLAITHAAVIQMSNATPGKIMIEKKRLFVGTGEDWLEILFVQPDGKKEMSAESFLAGYHKNLTSNL
jgi:methionyl-tRNA formyltransferase